MISPHTPPGTLLVVVLFPEVWDRIPGMDLPDLKKGDVVTLDCIVPDAKECFSFRVCLAEFKSDNFGYAPWIFEIAVLPKAITEIFTKAPSPRVLEDVK